MASSALTSITVNLKNFLKKYTDDLSTSYGTYYNYRNNVMILTFSVDISTNVLNSINLNEIVNHAISWSNSVTPPAISPIPDTMFLKDSGANKIDFLPAFWTDIKKYYSNISNQASKYINYLPYANDNKLWFVLFQPIDQYGRIYQDVGFGSKDVTLTFSVPSETNVIYINDCELHAQPTQTECNTVTKSLGINGTITVTIV
jgi:hypothetical protein